MSKRIRNPKPAAAPPPPSIQDLANQDKANRQQACEAELAAVLQKHNCQLATVQVWTNGRPGDVQVRVLAN